MNILVCVKQVPDTSEIQIDPVTHILIRDGVPSVVNPFDTYALEAAARIKDQLPETQIVVLTMGPPQAEKALRECLAIAADKAYLVSDRLFGGSDTLATSYILSLAVRALEEREGPFSAIFCGKQAIDGDTAQVGPELAEHLGIPQVTCALEARLDGEWLEVLQQEEDCQRRVRVALPCLTTFTKPAFNPRFPTIRRKMTAARAGIACLDAGQLPGLDRDRVGLSGSPTRVKRTFVPQLCKSGVTIQGEDVPATARLLAGVIRETVGN